MSTRGVKSEPVTPESGEVALPSGPSMTASTRKPIMQASVRLKLGFAFVRCHHDRRTGGRAGA